MGETRIPAAEITGFKGALLKRIIKKTLGQVPTSLGVYWHNQPVLMAMSGVGQKVQKWDTCDEGLKTFAHMAVASYIGCTWCLDFNYFEARNKDVDMDKAREVPRWRESDVFTPLEREVMGYAEAMSQTPVTVDDEMVESLRDAARRRSAGRAHRGDRVRELHDPTQRGTRHRVRRLRGRVRPQAPGRADRVAGNRGRRTVVTVNDPFVEHRSLLFTVAYEMLGSAADAEDVVQESWLRWSDKVDQAEVRDPRAYLVRIVTRQSLNKLRSLSRRREDYVGEWLPEPLLTSPDVAEDVELAENVSIAMLTVLETLGPAERAVFVLREVFDTPYDEIAEAVGKSPAAVRQIAHRAKEHVAARRPRMEVKRDEQEAAVERFLAAVQGGDMQDLLAVLAPDVVMVADGGGIAQAARKPIHGAEKVAAFLGTAKRINIEFTSLPISINGLPGARLDIPFDGSTTALSFVVEDGRITRIYAMRNPQKLQRLGEETLLQR